MKNIQQIAQKFIFFILIIVHTMCSTKDPQETESLKRGKVVSSTKDLDLVEVLTSGLQQTDSMICVLDSNGQPTGTEIKMEKGHRPPPKWFIPGCDSTGHFVEYYTLPNGRAQVVNFLIRGQIKESPQDSICVLNSNGQQETIEMINGNDIPDWFIRGCDSTANFVEFKLVANGKKAKVIYFLR